MSIKRVFNNLSESRDQSESHKTVVQLLERNVNSGEMLCHYNGAQFFRAYYMRKNRQLFLSFPMFRDISFKIFSIGRLPK